MDVKAKKCPICGSTSLINKNPLWKSYNGSTSGYYGCYEYVIRCCKNECPMSNVHFNSNDIFRSEEEAISDIVKSWNNKYDFVKSLIYKTYEREVKINMTGKVLGKIDFAEYGTFSDYPFYMGLHLRFKLGDGTSIGSGSVYTVNIDDKCRWEKEEKYEAITKNVEYIHKLLQDAKCNHVSDLIGKPVEVTVEKNSFKDFRILKEVL